ncbi:hypothetical protein INF28_11070 [Oscillospiraceae bacterium DSM 107454]|uniref:Copper amine oxidase-like N-terminal domain-containing protein n=2 Tax=Ructibacterium gallinarum TaxID=2779355 RepID=A0A9D5M7J5_9FIRM|nr:stalk domain-containing protein [Ructibacterium gallinarum]MBE5040999.1 hypothetical protein [Ructibacterium gallinarum]
MVPVRAIAEGLEASVDWDEAEQKVLITTSAAAQSEEENTAQPEITDRPEGMDDARAALSKSASVILKDDGTLWSMGGNEYGQLGYSFNYKKSMPKTEEWAQIEGIEGQVAAVYCGENTYYALCTDGSVWSWGSNANCLLGADKLPSELGSRCVPEKIEGLTDVRKISCGEHYTLALKADGTVWGWGSTENWVSGLSEEQKLQDAREEEEGILDDERLDALKQEVWGEIYAWYKVPTQVSVVKNVCDIAMGKTFALALRNDGLVYAWGNGSYSESEKRVLGQSAPKYYSVPRLIFSDKMFPERLTDIKAVAVGDSHAVALAKDGVVSAWERNALGVLGNALAANDAGTLAHPLISNGYKNDLGFPIMSGAKPMEDVIALSASAYYTVALKKDGTLYVWGESPLLPYREGGYREDQWYGITVHAVEDVSDVKRVYTTYQRVDDYYTRYEGEMKKKTWVEIPLPKLIVEKEDGTLWEINFSGNKQIADLKV